MPPGFLSASRLSLSAPCAPGGEMGFCVAWGSVITRGAQPSSRGSEAGVGAGGHRTRSGTRPAWNPGQATW